MKQSLELKEIAYLKAKKAYEEALQEFSQATFTDKVNRIQVPVAGAFGITPHEMLKQKRNRNIVVARQVSMALCRYNTDLSTTTIGQMHGGKDHSTVIHSIKKINDRTSL